MYLLLWTADRLTHPTFRNLTDSYEGWAYRNGLLRQTHTLEAKQFIERDRGKPEERSYRLTEKGRLHALGGRDPVVQWERSWDGWWRLALFDIPLGQEARRERLRRFLRNRGFGCLQGSVWVTPDSLEEEKALLSGGRIDVASLILLQARPCAGESDQEIVSSAWDFERINHSYQKHLLLLEMLPPGPLSDAAAARKLQRWAREERQSWQEIMEFDPLLPSPLQPSGYLGRKVWQHRVEVLREAGRLVRGFLPH